MSDNLAHIPMVVNNQDPGHGQLLLPTSPQSLYPPAAYEKTASAPEKILHFTIDEKPPRQRCSGMPKVLIVEDHADSLEATSLLLKLTGYEVSTAGNGLEALASAVDKTPDVLLLDLSLPEMDGVTLIRTVRSYQRLASIPVIVLTGLVAGKLLEEAKMLNVSSILLKSSTSFDQIRAALQQALSQTQTQIQKTQTAAQAQTDSRLHAPEKWREDSISPL
jgi:CheY-like chemotaxis protein